MVLTAHLQQAPQSPPTHTDLMDHKESQSSRVMLEWRFRQDRGEHDKPLGS